MANEAHATERVDEGFQTAQTDESVQTDPAPSTALDSGNAHDDTNIANGDTSETTNGSSAGPEFIELPVGPRDPQKRKEWLVQQQKHVFAMLALKCTRGREVKPGDVAKVEELKHRANGLLSWLEIEVQITPEIKRATKIDVGLTKLFNEPRYVLPQNIQNRARALYEQWESENWGQNEIEDDDEVAEDEEVERESGPPPAKRQKSNASKDSKDEDFAKIKIPSPNHPIWGKGGIMYGTVRGTRTYILHPQLKKRSFKVYGANGLENGEWVPRQLVAIFRGIHGASNAGISGNKDTGAYSIVISGQYDDLDKDYGEKVFYSGSGSHNNTNPNDPAKSTGGTQALHASHASGRPVRVLRSANGKGRFAPVCGLRYDGLYRVVNVHYPKNGLGGMYEQFELHRCEGQSEIARGIRPTPAEIRDYDKIQYGY